MRFFTFFIFSIGISAQISRAEILTYRQIQNLVTRLTLEEKLSLLGGDGAFTSPGVPRLRILPLKTTDGPLGIANAADWELGGPKATAFPATIGLAASWNPDLVREVGAAIAIEAKSLGKNMLLAPCVNIIRVPQNGRNFESLSEDPYLAGEMAAAYIEGVQSQKVLATVKHFAANNQETDRLYHNVTVDPAVLDEIYFPAFKRAIDAGVLAVMSSYNKLNGVGASENSWLLTDVLRKRWGFKGFVLSDWGATHLSQTVRTVKAGLDLEMPWAFVMGRAPMLEALEREEISEKDIDDKLLRRFYAMNELGLLIGDPQVHPTEIPLSVLESHRPLALKAAKESLVLLKNRDQNLPLKNSIKKILLLGPNAAELPLSGAGSGHVNAWTRVNLPEALKILLPKAEITVRYGHEDPAQLKRLVKSSEAVIFMMGLNKDLEGEARDRDSLDLPAEQKKLILDYAGLNSKSVVILNSGGMLLTSEWIDKVPSLIQAWYLGQEGGHALAQTLVGQYNPSGRLPITYLGKESDSWVKDTFPGLNNEVVYSEGVLVGYRSLQVRNIRPAFEFGFGLSYTSFELTRLPSPSFDQEIFKVKNIGNYDGEAVVKSFSPHSTQKFRQLRAFKKVFVKRGETRIVEL